MLSQVDELGTMTKRLGQVERSLVVGFVASTLYGALPEVVRRFRIAPPDVELTLVEISSVEQLEALKGGRIDVGFGRIRFTDDAIRREVLREEVLIVALPVDHPLLARSAEINLKALAADPLIVYPKSPRPSYVDQVLSAYRDRGLTPSVVREVRELQVALGLVAAGLGIRVVPASVQRLKRDDVIYRPITDTGVTSPIIMNTLIGDDRSEPKLLLTLIDQIYAEVGIVRGGGVTGALTPRRAG